MADLISGREVLAGEDLAGVLDAAVLVEDGRVVEVGDRATLEAQRPDARRWAFPGSWVLPGLVDAHVHLAFPGGPDIAAMREDDDETLLERMAGNADLLLRAGVTTARDLGDRGGLAVDLREAIAAGDIPGPRLLTATAPLTRPRGHCWFLGGEVPDAGTAGLLGAVDRVAEAGADVVKVMASGGGTTEGGAAMWEAQFDAAELRVIVERALEHGLPVAAHAHDTATIEACARAGVSTVEHCTWMTADGLTSRAEAEPVARLLADAGVAVCPAHPNDRALFTRLAGEQAADEMLGRLRWLADLGVRLIPGTDGGLAPVAESTNALIRLGSLGFSPVEVLRIATVEAAGALGVGAETGHLAPQLAADLVVVPRDPRRDLTALGEPEFVMARGRVADLD